QYEKSEKLFLNAIDIAKDLGLAWSIAQIQVQLCDLYFVQERLTESLMMIEASIKQTLPDFYIRLGSAYSYKARTLARLERLGEAKTAMTASLESHGKA
ncbi:MAG TPA: hypothetical protein PLZ51_07955, partial [Aggregatilineales bacterium]|nr:hypothetical protein [Aggregatilineales bacterium]